MEITSGPYCSGGALGEAVYFAATFAPHRLLVIVPNEIIGRLERDAAGTEEGWIALFGRHSEAIGRAVQKAIDSDQIGKGGWVRLRPGNFPAGSV
jgi:hypothetical protein